MSKKLLLLIALAVLLGVSVFYVWKQSTVVAPIISEPVVTPEPTPSDQPIDTSDWKTYRNEEYGFEFKYPEKYFYIKEDIDGANITYITILKNDRTGFDIDQPGKIGILLNDLLTEKYMFAKKQGICSNSIFNSYTVEICSEERVDTDLAQSGYESFIGAGLCEKGFGFSVPVDQRDYNNQDARRHVVYITCDKEDRRSMEMLFKVFQSIQFTD